MKSKQWIALGIVSALAMALIGCGTPNVHQRHEAQFLPDPVDVKTPAACRVVLSQDDPFIAAKRTPPWAQMPVTAQGGLVGVAVTLTMNGVLKGVNDIANEIRKENASKRSALLRGHGITKSTGAITGSFANPSNPKQTVKVNGVILQAQTNAQGYFLGTNQSGRLLLENK